MNKTLILLPLTLLGTCACGAALAASTYTWDLSTPLGNQGNTHSYSDTTSKYTLEALGFVTATAPPSSGLTVGTSTWTTGATAGNNHTTGAVTASALVGKNEGQYETGLGLAADAEHDNEIDNNQFVQLDLTNVKNAMLGNLNIQVGSVQAGEGVYIWGSTTQGSPGTLLASFTNVSSSVAQYSFHISQFPTFTDISVSAMGSGQNILIADGLTASTPEPGSVALLGAVAAPLGVMLRRRRKRSPAVR